MKKSVCVLMVITSFVLWGGFVDAAQILNFTYTADNMPRSDGWSIINYLAYEPGHVYLDPPGILHMNDPYAGGGSAAHYYKSFENLTTGSSIAIEWDVKAVYSNAASYFAIDDGVNYFAFDIEDDSIRQWGHDINVSATTVDTFHTYRAELSSGNFALFQDGNYLFSGYADASVSPGNARAHFGLGSSAGTAEFFIDEIRAYEITSTPVPEPATMLLLGSGLVGLAGIRKRSKRL